MGCWGGGGEPRKTRKRRKGGVTLGRWGELERRIYNGFLFCYTHIMMRKVVTKRALGESDVREDLEFWLSRSPEERVGAVEKLRRQFYGSTARLQRSARVVKRA